LKSFDNFGPVKQVLPLKSLGFFGFYRFDRTPIWSYLTIENPNEIKDCAMTSPKTNPTVLSNLSNRRRYLTPDEMDRLLLASEKSKSLYRYRNQAMILLAYRHGLRVSELVSLQWHQIDLKGGSIAISRLKHGLSSVHPLTAKELRMLKRLRKDEPNSRFVFLSQRGQPMTRQNVNVILKDIGIEAGIEITVFPHSLRHSCGHKLANEGKDTRSLQWYLGHKNIQHTVRYTELNVNRFNGWWQD
jgi:type 1 fimbriae regulatory protein FimB/type 1 fimbriae regulatory protein FimE